MSNINKYRQNSKTLVVDLAVNLVALHTNTPVARQKQPTLITPDDVLVTKEVGISTTQSHDLEFNCVTKILMLTAAHRFIVMHRDTETEDFRLLGVCNGLFVHTGSLMGQIRLVGDYEEAISCTVVYA